MTRVFARAGAKVVIVGRDAAAAQAAAKELGVAGGSVTAFAADVTNQEQMRAAGAGSGRVATVVSTYYAPMPGSFAGCSLKRWRRKPGRRGNGHQSQRHVSLGAGLCPVPEKSDQGRIVITSSITGTNHRIRVNLITGPTKAGQLDFMRTASIEWCKYAMTANAVMPGNILTEGLEGLGADDPNPWLQRSP